MFFASDNSGPVPPQVLEAMTRAGVPLDRIALHMHDTRGTELANILAGLSYGVRTFDASVAGLGGCPYAPGAAGNAASEDLIHVLEAMGYETGIDLSALIKIRTILSAGLPDEQLYGFLPDAGTPLGWEDT